MLAVKLEKGHAFAKKSGVLNANDLCWRKEEDDDRGAVVVDTHACACLWPDLPFEEASAKQCPDPIELQRFHFMWWRCRGSLHPGTPQPDASITFQHD